MYKILKNSWALFTGYFVLMVAHGFQGNLLGVRSVIEEFNFIATENMSKSEDYNYDGKTEWAALLRKLDKEQPDYKL